MKKETVTPVLKVDEPDEPIKMDMNIKEKPIVLKKWF